MLNVYNSTIYSICAVMYGINRLALYFFLSLVNFCCTFSPFSTEEPDAKKFKIDEVEKFSLAETSEGNITSVRNYKINKFQDFNL